MKDFLIIFVGATPRQNEHWWPSYRQYMAGMDHDIVLVHRNMEGVPDDILHLVTLENKILPSGEIPHKAFGAYRHYYQKYAGKYKYYAFISDDVYLRRRNWLSNVYEMFESYEGLGLISPMLHNNPPHARAPIWFASDACLSKLDWNFLDDHDGEMTIADRVIATDHFVAQIGHKIDFAYDPFWEPNANPRVCGAPQPNQWIERLLFGHDHFHTQCFSLDEIARMEKYKEDLFSDRVHAEISNPSIGFNMNQQRWNICLEVQPYHGLLYNKGIEIAKGKGHSISVYDREIQAGNFDPDNNVLFGASHHRYFCAGVGPHNPIAILQ
jgi:hypothetical protein